MALNDRTDPIAFARDMRRLRRPLRLRGRWRPPKDGLWRVATGRKVHGGFLVHRRRITRATPCVKRYIHILALRAEFWGTLEDCFIAASKHLTRSSGSLPPALFEFRARDLDHFPRIASADQFGDGLCRRRLTLSADHLGSRRDCTEHMWTHSQPHGVSGRRWCSGRSQHRSGSSAARPTGSGDCENFGRGLWRDFFMLSHFPAF